VETLSVLKAQSEAMKGKHAACVGVASPVQALAERHRRAECHGSERQQMQVCR